MKFEGETLMLENLKVFTFASELSRHAARQQSIVANNLANIDTPGFLAKAAPQFSIAGRSEEANAKMTSSRALHFSAPNISNNQLSQNDREEEAKPNGNSVSLEAETLKSIEAERLHSRSMAVYQASLNILRSSMGRGR